MEEQRLENIIQEGQKIRSRYFRTKPVEILKTSKKRKKQGKAHSNRNAKQDRGLKKDTKDQNFEEQTPIWCYNQWISIVKVYENSNKLDLNGEGK